MDIIRKESMTPLTSTLADLTAAKLVSYYPPPAPGVPIVQPSTDPAVYVQDPSYIKHLNEQCYQKYAVDVPNQWEADRFNFRAKQWEMSKSAFLPAPPKYVFFDANAFDQWWAQYNATMDQFSAVYGQNAPALFFVKPAPLPPDPVILQAAAPPPPAPAMDGPIGAPVPYNAGVFNPSSTDSYPDGYIYAGPTGIYQKHIYNNPFTAGNVRVLWVALQLTPTLSIAA